MQHVNDSSWELIIPSHDARPSANAVAMGATITPGQNAYGSWATVLAGASVTSDVYMIDVNINGIGVTTEARDSLTDIGVDPSGGTSPTVLIPTLLSSYAPPYSNNAVAKGYSYRFRVRIKAGSTIMARGMVNNATVRTQNVMVTLYCKPSRSSLVKSGSYVIAYGADITASCGTAMTAGTTSVGTYTQMGSAIVSPAPWDWCVAAAPKNSGTITGGNVLHVDMAIGSAAGTNRRVIANQAFFATTAEIWTGDIIRAYSRSAVADLVFARGWSNDATTAYSAIIYGTGG